MILTGVGAVFSASHKSPEGEMHGHSYEVIAWFRNVNRADARCFKAALQSVVSLWDHKVLPEDMSWGEDIARAVGCLANCVEVEVRRPLERFYARWKSEDHP